MNVRKLTLAAIFAVAMASATGAPRGVSPHMGAKKVTADITEAADFPEGDDETPCRGPQWCPR